MKNLIYITEAYKELEVKANEAAMVIPTGETYASHSTKQYTIGTDIIGVELLVYTLNSKGNSVSRKQSFEQKVLKVCDQTTEYSTMVELLNN